MLYSNQKHKDSRRNEVTDLPEHVKLPQHSSITIMSCLTWKLKCQLVYVCALAWMHFTSFYLGSSLYKCHCHAHPLLRQCIMAGGPTGLWTPLPHWEIVSLLYQWSHTRIPWAFTQLNKQSLLSVAWPSCLLNAGKAKPWLPYYKIEEEQGWARRRHGKWVWCNRVAASSTMS